MILSILPGLAAEAPAQVATANPVLFVTQNPVAGAAAPRCEGDAARLACR